MMRAKSSDFLLPHHFAPIFFARMLKGGCLARQIESIFA